MDSDDDEGMFRGLYENGQWLWDDRLKRMVFLSNLRPKTLDDLDLYTYSEQSGVIEFREDVDVIEQMRYRRHFQRKLLPGQANVITLQDIKDLVMYTAPVNFLSAKLINRLHTPTTERFLRALILYCAYQIQVTEEMTNRNMELTSKLRTPASDMLEEEYRDNIGDLRVLMAKEYCTMLVGAGDQKPYHHMGPLKKRRSLLEKDARTFEAFIRISVQIVYLALGRRYFHEIELETHRLMKSDTFNAVEHKSSALRAHAEHSHRSHSLTRPVLIGTCVRHDRQLLTHSPLLNELFCTRPIDYRLKGIGVVKYPDLTPRLRFFYYAIAAPEEIMAANYIAIGIIGLPRSKFDTMLRLLPPAPVDTKSRIGMSQVFSAKSVQSIKKTQSMKKVLYPEIVIPPAESIETTMPKGFHEEPEDINPVSDIQRRIWQNRFKTMMTLLTQHRRRR